MNISKNASSAQTPIFKIFLGILFFFVFYCHGFAALPDKPLIDSQMQQPNSHQIYGFLDELMHNSKYIHHKILGKTPGDNQFSVLLVSSNSLFFQNGLTDPNKLTVLFVGSLHGTELSGSEALQKLALELAGGNKNHFLENMNLILLVNANPDGRDHQSRFNLNKINLNTDFVNQSQPEVQMITHLINRYQPDVVLDLHESSDRKPILTLKEGYFKKAQAQYQAANNPNIHPAIRKLSKKFLLPEWLQVTRKNGLSSSRYIGQIIQLNQPVSQGGLGLGNLRNYAAMHGSFSFLAENRLDTGSGKITIENLRNRRDKQYITVISFLEMLNRNTLKILEAKNNIRLEWKKPALKQKNLVMFSSLDVSLQKPFLQVPLIETRTGKTVSHAFVNQTFLNIKNTIPWPDGYAVTNAQSDIAKFLDKHQIQYKTLNNSMQIIGFPLEITLMQTIPRINFLVQPTIRIEAFSKPQFQNLKKGDLLVNLHQPNGRLAALLLDPRSMSGIYQNNKTFRKLLNPGKPTDIYPVKELDHDNSTVF